MRLREDIWWEAGRKRSITLGAVPDPRNDDHKNWDPAFIRYLNDDAYEAAQIGDVWVARRSPVDLKTRGFRLEGHEDWPITGYGLTCPNERCEEGVHVWTHAHDCPGTYGKQCKYGPQRESCWTWSGSIEDGTLTAQPSLFCDFAECGWHGHLTNGVMTGTVEAKYQKAG